MRTIGKRIAALEQADEQPHKTHMVAIESNWDRELVLDHYGRDKIGPDDEVLFVSWDIGGDEAVYPAGFYDEGGRWAELCAARGIPHRDNPPCLA